jgi:hypothetical protein
MEQSQSIQKLASALLAFQVKVEAIHKDATNPHFRKKYASLTNIIEAIKDPLADCGLVVTQFPTEANGLTTTVIHAPSGEFMRSTYYMTPERQTPQGQGSVITYQRRYCLQAALNLCFEEDDDANASSQSERSEITPNAKKDAANDPTEWLNEGTQLFDKAAEKLKSGATTISKIRTAFKVSKKVEAALLKSAGISK